MQKTITIKKTSTHFELKEGDSLITSISLSELSLSGKELFKNLFDKYPIEDTEIGLRIDIDESISDSSDKRIANEIESILNDIADKIRQEKNIVK